MENNLIRYSVIADKNPREIVLLRGRGCRYRRCAFCDYHLDASADETANFALNRDVLARVTGKYGRLEVINSGSFCELDAQTMDEIERVCRARGIRQIHFECHYLYRAAIPALRARFAAAGVTVKVKQGVETFDHAFREDVLHKGIAPEDPAAIAAGFDEVCLLFGLTGQTVESMRRDVEIGLRHFERVCVNIMTENSTAIHPDEAVIRQFYAQVYPLLRDDPRVDVLLHNEDFGVGGCEHA